jgi:hypothetical protein
MIQARKLHCNVKEFKMQCALMMFSNDEPEIYPIDAKEFCYEYQLKSKFIDEDFKEDDKIKGFHYFKKDGNIKNDFKKDFILNAFSNIIFNSYKNPIKYPKEILKSILSTDDLDDTKKLMELFEITNNDNDKITNDELTFLLKSNQTHLRHRFPARYNSSMAGNCARAFAAPAPTRNPLHQYV